MGEQVKTKSFGDGTGMHYAYVYTKVAGTEDFPADTVNHGLPVFVPGNAYGTSGSQASATHPDALQQAWIAYEEVHARYKTRRAGNAYRH